MPPERAGDLAAGDQVDADRARPPAGGVEPDERVVVGEGDRGAPGPGGQLGNPLGRVGSVGGRWSGVCRSITAPPTVTGERRPGHRRLARPSAPLRRRGPVETGARHARVRPADAGAIGAQGRTVKEACGVFGVYAPGRAVAHLTFDGLYALQHRGQESAGMAVSDGETITVVKDMGSSRRSSTSARSRDCPATWPSATPGTRPTGRRTGATPSRSTARWAGPASPSATTAT